MSMHSRMSCTVRVPEISRLRYSAKQRKPAFFGSFHRTPIEDRPIWKLANLAASPCGEFFVLCTSGNVSHFWAGRAKADVIRVYICQIWLQYAPALAHQSSYATRISQVQIRISAKDHLQQRQTNLKLPTCPCFDETCTLQSFRSKMWFSGLLQSLTPIHSPP